MDHDTRDHIGVIESVSLDNRRGRALVRFGKSARASEIFDDVQDGIRVNVSVGYRVHEMVLEKSTDDGESYRVTDWEPLEVSLVSVPADATVGVGREMQRTYETLLEQCKEDEDMRKRNDNPGAPTEGATSTTQTIVRNESTTAVNNGPAPSELRTEGAHGERQRVTELMRIGQEFDAGELAEQAITEGWDASRLNEAILRRNHERGHGERDTRQREEGLNQGALELGLTEREVEAFSFRNLILAAALPNDRNAQERAAFELEVAREASDLVSRQEIRESRSEFTIPHEVLSRPVVRDRAQANRVVGMMQQRDLVAGTATAGGHTIATDLLAASFIDILRNRSFVLQVATILSDLRGNIAIPRQTAAAVASWLATEQGAASEQDQAFDQVTMSPKELGAFTEYSRQLLIQSSIDVESFIQIDLAIGIALAIDSGAINADGTGGAPTGIRSQTGVGAVVGGANGAAPTWDHVVDMETEVAIDNADVAGMAYAVNAATRGKMKKTFIDAGSGERLWDSRAGATPLNGYPAIVSNQLPSNLTKGAGVNLSAAVFGNWRDLLVGLWSGVDLMVNPYSGDTTRTTRVTAYQDVDIAVRHGESFSVFEDIDNA